MLLGVIAVAAAAREARDQRRFEQQTLGVDDLVIAAAAERAAKAASSRHVDGERSAPRQRRDATGMTSDTAGWRPTSGANASSTTQAKRAPGSRRRASVSAGM